MSAFKFLVAAACLIPNLALSEDISIGDSAYICRTESGQSSLYIVLEDNSLEARPFSTANNLKKKAAKLQKKVRSLKSGLADLSKKAKNKRRQKIRTLRARSKEYQQLSKLINQCREGTLTCGQGLSGVAISGSANGRVNRSYTFSAVLSPAAATGPITYEWSPEPASGQGTGSASYQWSSIGSQTVSLNASNCGGSAAAQHTIEISESSTTDPVQPADLVYQGAFRLPGDGERPLTFAYGGNAMTFNPDGDSTGTDAFPGSLFITGHDRIAWGDVPNGDQVAEVSVPVPVISANLEDLPTAAFIQNFTNVAAGRYTDVEEIPRIGIQYLNHSLTGPLIHISWAQHLQEEPNASLGWFSANLSTPNFQGNWFLGSQPTYAASGYLFDIPEAWADINADGRYLAIGRYRDGGQGGMGPSLFAYKPWQTDGSAPASGTHISETTLLLYDNAYNTDQIVRCMNGYQHTDEWEGGAWINSPSGKEAVIFSGNKSTGSRYWYGFRNAAGPQYPCVHQESIGEFRACITSDGTDCPASEQQPCTEIGERGWWASEWQGQIIFYDPADLAEVAAGELESWEPQPYAALNIEEHLFLNPTGTDVESIGTGVQRRVKIGPAAYDRVNGLLYVIEFFADEAKPVVHVWKIS